jgi:hypothetical protein
MSIPVRITLFLMVALVAWFIWDAYNEPGVQDLKGGIEEVAVYRNENNTGPIIRIYAVTVADTQNAEMEQYGNFMPYTKYGNTKVYFFRKDKPFPKQVYPGEENFSAEFQKELLAKYEKDAMGRVTFRKF